MVSLMVGSARARLAPDSLLPSYHTSNGSEMLNFTHDLINNSTVDPAHMPGEYYPIVVVTSLSFLTGAILVSDELYSYQLITSCLS